MIHIFIWHNNPPVYYPEHNIMGRNRKRRGNNVVHIADPAPDLRGVCAKLAQMAQTATALYDKCVQASIPDVLCPAEWILNQTEMHQFWNALKPLIADPKYNPEKTAVFATYMDYMCVSYPPGFGDKIRTCYQTNAGCNGAEIYQHLSYNAL